jgi:hypothetical protein
MDSPELIQEQSLEVQQIVRQLESAIAKSLVQNLSSDGSATIIDSMKSAIMDTLSILLPPHTFSIESTTRNEILIRVSPIFIPNIDLGINCSITGIMECETLSGQE